jgi:hypothetical protein
MEPILAAIDEWLSDPLADPPAGDAIRTLRLALVAETAAAGSRDGDAMLDCPNGGGESRADRS